LGVELTPGIRPEEDLVRLRALLPLSGIAFVALIVIGLAVGGSSPSPDAAADEVVSFYRDNENRARAGIWFFAFAMPFLPLFASSLAGLQRPEGHDSRVVWRRLLLVGSAIMSAMLGVAITTQLALADSTEPQIAPEVMQALNVLAGHVVYALLPATGTMMLGAAGWLLGRDRVQGWLGWAALILGIGLFVPFFGVLAFVLSLVWIIVVSITLFRARAAGPTAAAA
jgi:MFS family permease